MIPATSPFQGIATHHQPRHFPKLPREQSHAGRLMSALLVVVWRLLFGDGPGLGWEGAGVRQVILGGVARARRALSGLGWQETRLPD